MPTLNVTLFDTRVSLKQKRQLADSLTKVVVETLGSSPTKVTIVFKAIAGDEIARGGRLGSR